MSSNALDLHRRSIVVDTHCDTLKCLTQEFTRTKGSMWKDRSSVGMGVRSELGHVDIPRLRDGGVDCQVFAVSSARDRTPPHALRTALDMIDVFHGECERNSDAIRPVTCHDDIVEAVGEGKVAAMLSIEGADVIEGRLSMLRVFHRLGVRMVGLVHSLRNLLADGVSDARTGGGLSELGVKVVEELDRLGVIVDVSHINDAGFWDVNDISRNPVIASHSNSRAICGHPRNMTDDMIVALADGGGVMGMNFAPSFVHPTAPTVETLVNHVDHIVDLVDSDHVGLGSDFDGIRSTPVGLEDVTKMPGITEELLRRGYGEDDVKKILGGNHLRLIKRVVG
ncbi:MAG: dipeptidase [Candidatus Bathyarchaeota archaeon]|nr:MAG: dipeptidase [Candidatus Bathyarchaeota archaeon]